jgi:uncharacterized membrane protein
MRRVIIAAVVALVLFAVGAFAASLTVNSEDVASGSDDVAACAARVDVDFTTDFDNTAGEWVVTQVVLSFLTSTGEATTGCDDQGVQVALTTGASTAQELTGTVDGSGATLTPTSTVLVEEVTNAAVLVEEQPIATGPVG